MSNALLVYEKMPTNAALLARLAPTLELMEVRSLVQLKEAFFRESPLLVAVEPDPEANVELADLIAGFRCDATRKFAVVVCGRANRGGVWPLYESGVDFWFGSILDANRFERFAKQVLQELGCEAEHELASSRIWARLPWARHARGGGGNRKKGNNT